MLLSILPQKRSLIKAPPELKYSEEETFTLVTHLLTWLSTCYWYVNEYTHTKNSYQLPTRRTQYLKKKKKNKSTTNIHQWLKNIEHNNYRSIYIIYVGKLHYTKWDSNSTCANHAKLFFLSISGISQNYTWQQTGQVAQPFQVYFFFHTERRTRMPHTRTSFTDISPGSYEIPVNALQGLMTQEIFFNKKKKNRHTATPINNSLPIPPTAILTDVRNQTNNFLSSKPSPVSSFFSE